MACTLFRKPLTFQELIRIGSLSGNCPDPAEFRILKEKGPKILTFLSFEQLWLALVSSSPGTNEF